MTTKSKYSPTKPFLPPEVMNCNKEKMVSTNKIVIDLKKEFDEDKELLDLLNNTQKQGTPKSPHIRRSHFHSYWTGNGENKQLVVKWVNTIFVKGSSENLSTIHDVK